MAILDWILGNKLWDRVLFRKFIANVFRRDIHKVLREARLGRGRSWPALLWRWGLSWFCRELWSRHGPLELILYCSRPYGNQTFVSFHKPSLAIGGPPRRGLSSWVRKILAGEGNSLWWTQLGITAPSMISSWLVHEGVSPEKGFWWSAWCSNPLPLCNKFTLRTSLIEFWLVLFPKNLQMV